MAGDRDANAGYGLLIYFKPLLHDDATLPTDVSSYGASGKGFPHEQIPPGAISQQQFESYRALGRHAIEVIGRSDRFDSVDGFAARAHYYREQLLLPDVDR